MTNTDFTACDILMATFPNGNTVSEQIEWMDLPRVWGACGTRWWVLTHGETYVHAAMYF